MGIKEIQEMMEKQAKAMKQAPIASSSSLAGHIPPPPSDAGAQAQPARAGLGEELSVEGTARDAALGALVECDDGTSYYVEGHEWDEQTSGKRVVVTGTLECKPIGPPTRNAAGEIQHGADGNQDVLANPTWRLA